MNALPAWLRHVLTGLVLCAGALLLNEMFVQARAGGTFTRGWNVWLAVLRDVKTVAFVTLGVVMGVIATRLRLPF